MRSQFSHVIDVAPTVLEAAGLPEPTMVNGVQQSPYEGTSMLYSFNDAKAPERHETQYFEMFCNRGIYHKGWSAVTKHRTPWAMGGAKMPAFDDDVWELYDGSKDWTQANDLSKQMPEKLHELQRLWLIEAVKYNVLPLDDRQIERFVPELAGRPALIKGNRQLLFAGMGRLSENSVVSIKNKSFAVTADLDVPAKGAEGVIIAQGGRFGGWSLYAKGGKAKFVYNVLGIKSYDVESTSPIPAGKTQVRMEFAYDGGGRARAATSRSTATARRWARAASSRRRVSSSRPTRRPTSATSPARPSAPTTPRTPAGSTARSTGCRSTSDKDAAGRRPLHLAGGAAARRDGATVALATFAARHFSGAPEPEVTGSGAGLKSRAANVGEEDPTADRRLPATAPAECPPPARSG